MRKYFKHTIQQTLSIKKILTLDFISWQETSTPSQEIHNFWEFIYISSGHIECIVNNKKVNLREGQVYLLPPNTLHQFNILNKKGATLFIVCFECLSPSIQALADLPLFLSSAENILLSNVINEVKLTFKTSFFNKLTPLETPVFGGEQCIKNLFEVLIIKLLRNSELSAQNKMLLYAKDNAESICAQIQLYLEKNIYNKVTIDELANSLNYSKYYILHIFKQHNKKTIIDAFNELKIKEAKKLLEFSSNSIKTISETLNFSNPHFFNYTFKKYTNCTPSSYRQQTMKQNYSPFIEKKNSQKKG